MMKLQSYIILLSLIILNPAMIKGNRYESDTITITNATGKNMYIVSYDATPDLNNPGPLSQLRSGDSYSTPALSRSARQAGIFASINSKYSGAKSFNLIAGTVDPQDPATQLLDRVAITRKMKSIGTKWKAVVQDGKLSLEKP